MLRGRLDRFFKDLLNLKELGSVELLQRMDGVDADIEKMRGHDQCR
jgi:hypothetical protein